jgi:signal peptidase II
LTFVKNNGVAFGMFQGIPHFFTLTSIVISIGALLFYRYQLPNNRPWIQISVGMIVGGAIGNIIDRIRYGYVVDFVHVSWFPGIFNMADSAITIGVLMLAGYLLFLGESGTGTARQQPADEALLGELLSKDQWRGDRR